MQNSLALSDITDKPLFSQGLTHVLKFKSLSRLPDYPGTRVNHMQCVWRGRGSNAQSLWRQKLCENKGLQMLGKQINRFDTSLYSVQLYKPFYGFS